MPSRRVNRLFTAFFVVLSLLFSQLAMASYICPAANDAGAMPKMAEMPEMAEMAASGMPCDGMDQVQPALCHEHSASSPQSFEPVKLPAASQPMVVQVLELAVVLDAADAVAPPFALTAEARPPPGPLFLSTFRLRV